MSAFVPRQCRHIRKEALPNLKPPNSWLQRLSAEHNAVVPLNGHDIPSTWMPYNTIGIMTLLIHNYTYCF